jgi:DNA-binding NarL/FixJ family response regulator
LRLSPYGVDPVRGIFGLDRLTEREKEVLLLLGMGMGTGTGLGKPATGGELRIAERTVRAHIARIVDKLGQRTRLQAAVLSVLVHHALCTDTHCACRHAATAVEDPPLPSAA